MPIDLNEVVSLKRYFSDRSGLERSIALNTLIEYNEKNTIQKLSFVMYWGASAKLEANKADKDALLYLFHFLKSVEQIFDQEVGLTVIFTDTHAFLNGYTDVQTRKYFEEIHYHISRHKFTTLFLSELCYSFIRSRGFMNYQQFIYSIITLKDRRFATYPAVPEIIHFSKLAAKHCRRIGNHESGFVFDTDVDAAMAYLYLNSVELEITSRRFSSSIFLTYASRLEEFTLPSLPVIRLFSLKSGLRTRPWFA